MRVHPRVFVCVCVCEEETVPTRSLIIQEAMGEAGPISGENSHNNSDSSSDPPVVSQTQLYHLVMSQPDKCRMLVYFSE